MIRHRNTLHCLDSEIRFTRGVQSLLISTTLELCFPNTHQFTATVADDQGVERILGQFILEDSSARLTFIFPDGNEQSAALSILLDSLVWQCGEMGGQRFLAEVEDGQSLTSALRRSGFCPVCQQYIWKATPNIPALIASDFEWRNATNVDFTSIRSLYKKISPPAVQSALPLTPVYFPSLVLKEKNETIGFARVRHQNRNILITPHLINQKENEQMLAALFGLVSGDGNHIYVVERSYQPWLKPALAGLAQVVSPCQIIMVKHLMLAQKVVSEQLEHVAVEHHRAQPTTPIVSSSPREKC